MKRIIPVVILLITLAVSTAGAAATTIKWWAPDWQEERAEKLLEQFHAENPDIRVEVEYLPWTGMQDQHLVGLRGGRAADVIDIAIAWNQPYAALGLLRSLDEFLDRVERDDFFDGGWNTAVYQGTLYGIPHRSEAHGLFYNKDLFRAAGLDPERAPETWDELREMAIKIAEATNSFGAAVPGGEPGNLSAQLLPMVWAFGGDILNEDYTEPLVEEEAFRQAVDYFVSFAKDLKVAPSDSVVLNNREIDQLFLSGMVAISSSGQYLVPDLYGDAPDLEFGTALLPRGPAGRFVVLGGWNYVMAKNTKHPEEAWRLIEFLTSPGPMAYYTDTFPARKSAGEDPRFDDPKLEPFLEMLNYARNVPEIPQWPAVQQAMHSEVQAVMAGQKDTATAMKHLADEIRSILQQ